MGREEKSPGKRTVEGLEFSAQALLELTKPHIESFDYFVDRGLQAAVLGVQPVQVTHPMLGNTLRIWIEKPAITPPMRDLKDSVHSVDHRLLPAECRQAGLSYRGNFTADVCLQANDKSVMRQSISFGRMPIMVKSSICHLRGLEQQRLIAAKEESLEMGGYFICNGIERVIRLLIVPKRNYPMGLIRGSFKNRGPSYSDKAVMIRCVRPDQSSVTMRLYYLQTGNAKLGFAIRKQEYLVPVGIILKALIEVSEKEIYEHISCIHNDRNKGERGAVGSEFVSQRARIILEEVKRLQLHTRTECLKFLGETFRPVLDGVENQSVTQIGEKVLVDFVLVHLDNNYDKFNLVILMLQKLFALADATAAADNADVMQHHELLLPGHLLTMFVKERFQDWLAKVKLQLIKEMEEKPHQVDLLDREAHDLNPLRPIGPLPKEYLQQVNKAMEKVPSDIGKRVEYLLNTGNLVSPGGLDLQQTSGFTVVAEKLNFFRYLSHFRSVHRGAFFAQLRTTAVRKLLPESWGFMCPVHTPDGSPCGLLMHLTCTCQISSDLDAKGIMKDPLRMRKGISSILVGMGMIPALPQLARVSPPEYLAVLLDGRVLGYMRTRDIPQAVSQLRVLKTSQVPDVPEDLEVAHVPCTNAGAFPGLFLASTPARFVRPVLQLFQTDTEEPKAELIGPFEQAYMEIKCLDGGDGGRDKGAPPPTHQETSPTGMLSIVANLTPWSDHNQSPRNMYQCQMGKQTMGFPAQALQFRADNKMYRLQTPQSPIARTATYKKYGMDEFPNGTNAVVAVLAYTGYDMEDAMIINKSSMERGLAHGQIYKTEIVDLTRLRRKGDGIVYQFKKAEDGRKVPYHSAKDQFIDRDGLPYIGQVMKEGDSYCSVLNTMLGKPKTSKIKGSDVAVVDYVAALGTGPKDPMQKVAIRMRYGRNPVIGDKFSSRHGQKGVLSNLWPDIDMPFSAVTGMRPDIIINPHAFPSRMTIGMLIESIAAKAGALRGEFVDASPFKKCRTTKVGESGIDEKQSAIDEFGKQLAAFGFSYHGTEVMYSGLLGTEMPCEIFMGVVYYQRLRHMVGDKFQVRSLGPVNPVTRQPVKGRKLGGGIRFGEMERDSLLAHGAAYLLQDRLHTCSDYHTADVCSLCGSLLSPVPAYDASHPAGQAKSKKVMCRVCKTSRGIEKVAMPYVFRYLAAELAAMNIKMYLKTSAPP